MSTWQKAVIGFWVFVGIMLLWNFSSYNQSLTKQATDHPQQQHFYFFKTNAAAATMVRHDAPDIRQTDFKVKMGEPASSFTCLVTIKNIGTVKAENISVCVRPYRGISTADPDGGGGFGGPLREDDPLSQLSDYLSFPDLAPGESATEPDIFFNNHPELPTGVNPDPKITFDAVKPTPGAPAKPGN